MDILYKLFVANWHEIGDKKDTTSKFMEGAYFLSAIIVHAILLIYWCIFADFLFIALNIFSILLNSVCLFFNRRNRHEANILLSSGETMIFGAISACRLGWAFGFQWYILIALLPYYFFLDLSVRKKVTVTFFAIIAFYTSYFYGLIYIENVYDGYHILSFLNLNITFIGIFLEIKINDIAQSVNNQYIEKLKRDANEDHLTGLWNRRYAESFFENRENLRYDCCVALIDIDHFKKINDTYGHEAGDRILIEFSQYLKKRFRSTDTIIRWGGEEIIIVLIRISLEKAYEIMDNVRMMVSEQVYLINGNEIKFTITIGLVKADIDKNPDEIIRESDMCMYYGKENGRNRVVTMDMIEEKPQ